MPVSRESPPCQFLAIGSAMSGPQRYQHGFCRYVHLYTMSLFVVYQAIHQLDTILIEFLLNQSDLTLHAHHFNNHCNSGGRGDTFHKTVKIKCAALGGLSATTQKLSCREWVAEDFCMLSILLAGSSCFNSFGHGTIPIYIVLRFYMCIYTVHNFVIPQPILVLWYIQDIIITSAGLVMNFQTHDDNNHVFIFNLSIKKKVDVQGM